MKDLLKYFPTNTYHLEEKSILKIGDQEYETNISYNLFIENEQEEEDFEVSIDRTNFKLNEKKIDTKFLSIANQYMEALFPLHYGQPKIIEPESEFQKDNIIFGNSASKWTDSKKDNTIYFYNNYLQSEGKQVLGFSLYIISNKAEYSSIMSEQLQNKKVIDFYNTRF